MACEYEEYVYPKCPKCFEQLTERVGTASLCSCPPYYAFKCPCGWEGYEMLEYSEKYLEERKGSFGKVKFSTRVRVLNDKFFEEFKKNE